MGKSWCPDHFVCANPRCGVKLVDIGFIEEGGFLYCEKDYEQYFAPHCAKCEKAIVGVGITKNSNQCNCLLANSFNEVVKSCTGI